MSPALEVLALERELPVPSFTIDTLQWLQKEHPDKRFRLLVGADILEQTEAWKDWEGIARDFDPLVVGRAGFGEVPGVPTFPELASTTLRERLSRGESVDALVTARVAALLPGSYGA